MECMEDTKMLVLTRKLGEKILIGDDIVITVVEVGKSRLKLGIKAPAGARILRSELDPTRTPTSLEPGDGAEDVLPIRSKRRRRSRRQWAPARVDTIGA
jgi:carbon storage regulator